MALLIAIMWAITVMEENGSAREIIGALGAMEALQQAHER